VVYYPGKLKLILTGFAEAAIAARSAYALIHPETPLHFEYSTTAGFRASDTVVLSEATGPNIRHEGGVAGYR